MPAQSSLSPNLHPSPWGKRVAQGAGIAFILAAVFMVFFASGARLAFGLWTVLPLLTVPVAGAFGGLLYYLLDHLRYQGGWQKIVANVVSLAVYGVLLWLSLVAAFAATGLWD
ncbi:potassium transporter KefB [Hymenobacter edaphi]|uniref:Potassium transporter KefB n=1 Tax=Hymenobacter edaphi TaxID=2211146 RepID=A0A328BWM5_9BACT|nr:potassium transporter KefB [Hymenobacter edaphi]RAK70466.1 potassium transporter KefB [Hymenobacter edaphi]